MNDNQFVIFTLADEEYGIKIENIETIERIMDITRVPKSKNYVKGVINLRGEIVPIIDLRERLGLKSKEFDADSRIIVLKMLDMLIGFIVDSTSEVKDIPNSSIDFSSMEEIKDDSFVRGVAKIDHEMIILLDINKIIEKE